MNVPMPWNATGSLIYIVVLASAYYAYRTVPDTLNHIRNLAACPEQGGPGPRKQLQKDAENAIGIDSLRVLSESVSYDLRASTIKIVASRTVKSRTKKLLLKDLASKDEDRRYKAICAVWMLVYNPALHVSPGKSIVSQFMDYRSFYSIITALKNVLSDHQSEVPQKTSAEVAQRYPEPELPPSPIKPPFRPVHETCLILILNTLLDPKRSGHSEIVACALNAGLVTRWLKDYPFPCALPQNSKYNFKKSDVLELCEDQAWWEDDRCLASIVGVVSRTATGKKQLRDAGLCGSSGTGTRVEFGRTIAGRWRRFPSRLNTIDTNDDVRMVNGEDTAGASTPPPIALGRQWGNADPGHRTRSQELSPEEENLRRRRREAVVVAEPGAPISQENILQRTDSGSAWRQDLESNRLDGTASDSTGSEVAPTRSVEQQMMELLAPFRAERSLHQRLHEDANDPDRVPYERLNEYVSLVSRVMAHRKRVAATVRLWNHVSLEERQMFLDQVNTIVDVIMSDPLARLALYDVEQNQAEATEEVTATTQAEEISHG